MNFLNPLQKTISIAAFLLLTDYSLVFSQNNIRPLEQLTADTSGWRAFKDATKIARNEFEILAADPSKARDAIYQTQITTHSIMGAIIYFSGGILIDNGWIRILGSGNEKLSRSVPGWNKVKLTKNLVNNPIPANCRRCDRRFLCRQRRCFGMRTRKGLLPGS